MLNCASGSNLENWRKLEYMDGMFVCLGLDPCKIAFYKPVLKSITASHELKYFTTTRLCPIGYHDNGWVQLPVFGDVFGVTQS